MSSDCDYVNRIRITIQIVKKVNNTHINPFIVGLKDVTFKVIKRKSMNISHLCKSINFKLEKRYLHQTGVEVYQKFIGNQFRGTTLK